MTLEEIIRQVMEENPNMTYEEAKRIAKIRKLKYDLPDPMEHAEEVIEEKPKFVISDEWKEKIRNLKISEDEKLDAKLRGAKHIKDTVTGDNRIVLKGKTKKAKSALIEKWKNLSKKKKGLLIAGAAILVVGVVAISQMLTGDTSMFSHAGQLDLSNITDIISSKVSEVSAQTPDLTAVNNFTELDPSANTDAINQIAQAFDPSVDLSGEETQIFTNAYDASSGTNGLEPTISNAYVGDLFNTQTGEYANIDPSNLTMDQLKDLDAQGFDAKLLTNDPNMIGQGGNTIAEANAATGFIK